MVWSAWLGLVVVISSCTDYLLSSSHAVRQKNILGNPTYSSRWLDGCVWLDEQRATWDMGAGQSRWFGERSIVNYRSLHVIIAMEGGGVLVEEVEQAARGLYVIYVYEISY